ncbi:MAG: DUF6017 domain-containing protein, partial [Lachnospiraceae bacterium]|nr:DUF6017 domain-containing protein [Lachnospiraceae bacterium]
MTDPLVKQKQYTELIRSNVNYAALVLEYPDDVERIDELIRVMVNVICFGEGSYNINHCKVPAKVIASQFCKLDREHEINGYYLGALCCNARQFFMADREFCRWAKDDCSVEGYDAVFNKIRNLVVEDEEMLKMAADQKKI